MLNDTKVMIIVSFGDTIMLLVEIYKNYKEVVNIFIRLLSTLVIIISTPVVAQNAELNELLNLKTHVDHSKNYRIINPFDGALVNILINPNSIPDEFKSFGKQLELPTSGSYYFNNYGYSGDVVRVDVDEGSSDELLDELLHYTYSGYTQTIVPLFISPDHKSEIKAIKAKVKYDVMYTILHELAHTTKIANTQQVARLISSKIEGNYPNKSTEIDVYTSIMESIADISAIIYIYNNELMPSEDLRSLLAGLIIDRITAKTKIVVRDGEELIINGDMTHDTSESLIKLYRMMYVEPEDPLDLPKKSINVIDKSLEIIKATYHL